FVPVRAGIHHTSERWPIEQIRFKRCANCGIHFVYSFSVGSSIGNQKRAGRFGGERLFIDFIFDDGSIRKHLLKQNSREFESALANTRRLHWPGSSFRPDSVRTARCFRSGRFCWGKRFFDEEVVVVKVAVHVAGKFGCFRTEGRAATFKKYDNYDASVVGVGVAAEPTEARASARARASFTQNFLFAEIRKQPAGGTVF